MRSPTPDRDLGTIGSMTDFNSALNILIIELSSRRVADIYTRLGHSENEGNLSINGKIGVMENDSELINA